MKWVQRLQASARVVGTRTAPYPEVIAETRLPRSSTSRLVGIRFNRRGHRRHVQIGRGLRLGRDKFHLPPAGWSRPISRPVLRAFHGRNTPSAAPAPARPTPRIRQCLDARKRESGQDLHLQRGVFKLSIKRHSPGSVAAQSLANRSARRGAAFAHE